MIIWYEDIAHKWGWWWDMNREREKFFFSASTKCHRSARQLEQLSKRKRKQKKKRLMSHKHKHISGETTTKPLLCRMSYPAAFLNWCFVARARARSSSRQTVAMVRCLFVCVQRQYGRREDGMIRRSSTRQAHSLSMPTTIITAGLSLSLSQLGKRRREAKLTWGSTLRVCMHVILNAYIASLNCLLYGKKR